MNLGKFSISWAWPVISGNAGKEGDVGKTNTDEMDATITHAVVEYREGERVERKLVNKPPFIFEGKLF